MCCIILCVHEWMLPCFPQTHWPMEQQASHFPQRSVTVETSLQVCMTVLLPLSGALVCTCILYCKPLHFISLYISCYIVASSETPSDAARQPPPMRRKTCSPESITTGMCHDVIVYNVMTQHCTCVTVVQYTCTCRYEVCLWCNTGYSVHFVIVAAWIYNWIFLVFKLFGYFLCSNTLVQTQSPV